MMLPFDVPLDEALDGFRYAFMLPVAVCVATSCQLLGVGGAALFSPIFLLVFPALGPEYPLPSAAAAIASALLTEVFGFAAADYEKAAEIEPQNAQLRNDLEMIRRAAKA